MGIGESVELEMTGNIKAAGCAAKSEPASCSVPDARVGALKTAAPSAVQPVVRAKLKMYLGVKCGKPPRMEMRDFVDGL